MRSELSANQIIKLTRDNETKRESQFKIEKCLGGGASCFAYKTLNMENNLYVVVKECFPIKAAKREENDTIAWNSTNDEINAKENFCRSYRFCR